MNLFGKMNGGGGQIVFSHGSCHSKGVCTLINPSVNTKIEFSF